MKPFDAQEPVFQGFKSGGAGRNRTDGRGFADLLFNGFMRVVGRLVSSWCPFSVDLFTIMRINLQHEA